ncbi:MAG: ribosome-associated translation inhibitor RaiA [Candidatus Paceibacterota bacterium]|jgi:ribosomal subunit interface protein
MEIKIKATNLELTEYLRKLVDQKIKKISKLLPEYPDLIIEVELDKITKHHQKGDIFRSEVQFQVPGGKMIRAESSRENFRLSLSDVKEQLMLQIKKYKDKTSVEKRRKL